MLVRRATCGKYTCDGLQRNIRHGVSGNYTCLRTPSRNNIPLRASPTPRWREVREAARKARCHDFIMAQTGVRRPWARGARIAFRRGTATRCWPAPC